MPDDNSLHDVITEKLASDLVYPEQVVILVRNGSVTLSGEVGRYSEKCAAIGAVKSTVGVVSLTDDLQIVRRGTPPSDAALAETAKRALEANVFIPSTRISVEAAGGCVTLGGSVLYYREKIDAENAIRLLPGLKGIQNEIDVVNPAAPKGMSQSIIDDAISSIPGVDYGAIKVTIDSDVATLKGRVRTLAERDDLEAAAWSAPDIKHVQNEVQVQK